MKLEKGWSWSLNEEEKGNMGETEWKQDQEFDEEENEVEWMPEKESKTVKQKREMCERQMRRRKRKKETEN